MRPKCLSIWANYGTSSLGQHTSQCVRFVYNFVPLVNIPALVGMEIMLLLAYPNALSNWFTLTFIQDAEASAS
jgi:hypothetical protein